MVKTSLKRWTPVSQVLDEFQASLHPNVPTLSISVGPDMSWSDEKRLAMQRETKFHRQFGVYLMFNRNEELTYVGVAMYAFDKRIWSHDDAVTQRYYTDLIAFPHTHYHLALALEFLLIVRLHPPVNKSYKGYTVPLPDLESR